MTVKELKEKLNEYSDDTIVAVGYRDDGGSYGGCDKELEFYTLDHEEYSSEWTAPVGTLVL